MRRHARAWTLRAVRAAVSSRPGFRAINVVHRRLSPALRQRFFHLTCQESICVEGAWWVDFAGRDLVLPLRRDFPLAWTAAVGFHGYDPELHELYASLVTGPSPPRVFFDVGANYGLHSLRMLAHGVRVVSFEPNPECHPFFLECCQANGLVPEIVPAAVGAGTGRATLMVPAGRSYLGSIIRGVAERWGERVTTLGVPLTSLDHFVAERGIVPDLVKIDVEGGELDVLDGARRLLARARPIVVFESWTSAWDRRLVFDLFAALGYGLEEAGHGRRHHPLRLAAFLESPGVNFVAMPLEPSRARSRAASPRALAPR